MSDVFGTVDPDLLLLGGAEQPKTELVDRVAGARQRLDLGYRSAVFIFVGAKRVPTCLREALGGHHREGLFVSVEHHHAGVHRHALHGGVDEHDFARRNTVQRRVESALRRVEARKLLLPDPHNLFRAYLGAAQTHFVGFLPELAETLQRTGDAVAFNVEIDGFGRHLGNVKYVRAHRPRGSVARLRVLGLVLGGRRLLCHASSFRLRRSACPTRLTASGNFGESPLSHTLQDNRLPSVTTTVMRTAFRANESRTPEDSSPMRISDVCLYLRYWRWIFRGGVHSQGSGPHFF